MIPRYARNPFKDYLSGSLTSAFAIPMDRGRLSATLRTLYLGFKADGEFTVRLSARTNRLALQPSHHRSCALNLQIKRSKAP